MKYSPTKNSKIVQERLKSHSIKNQLDISNNSCQYHKSSISARISLINANQLLAVKLLTIINYLK